MKMITRMNMKLIKIYTTIRNDKVSIWVQMDKEDPWNIWDLSKREFTPEVFKAIVSAFERGCKFMRIAMDDVELNISSEMKHLKQKEVE